MDMHFISEAIASSGPLAIVVSLIMNVIISVLSFIPSVFITAANITVFGFQNGLIVSYIGEIIGAAVSFWLYRRGIQSIPPKFMNNRWIMRLQKSQGFPAFWMILLLRLLPFIPSGVINLAAALSRASMMIFFTATSIGKLPALLIEAYSVTQVMKASYEVRIGLVLLISIIALLYYVKKTRIKN
ncbi:TVP38/TMEM64 family protein [Peribacillus muralis]|uniref:TVP38/TMEM64 family protein n=1 Tax=Peribacillus muralis TaxID=264697 RepID=UPI000709A79D|nr:VTT domain-containing protein [Peribacillus muralis]